MPGWVKNTLNRQTGKKPTTMDKSNHRSSCQFPLLTLYDISIIEKIEIILNEPNKTTHRALEPFPKTIITG
jgi:hypothetical protein